MTTYQRTRSNLAVAAALVLFCSDMPLAAAAAVAVPPTDEIARTTFAQWLTVQHDNSRQPTTVSRGALQALLSRTIELAATRSPQLQQRVAEQKAAEYDLDESKGQRWPQVNVGLQSRSLQPTDNSYPQDVTNTNALNVSVTTTVFDWGRNSKTIESREQLVRATDAQKNDSLQNTGYEVCALIVEIGRYRMLTATTQRLVWRMRALVDMLTQIVASDRGRNSELIQARAKLLQAEELRDANVARFKDHRLALRKLIGDEEIVVPNGMQWPLAAGDLSSLLATLPQHPAVRQAQAETDAARINAEALRAANLPKLDWVVRKTTAPDSYGRTQPWQTLLVLNWEAFDGGAKKSAQQAAVARADASQEKKRQALLDLEYRVRAAYQDAATLQNRALAYRALVSETAEVRRVFFEQWYHLGRRSLLDVLNAENDHYTNQVNETISEFDGYLAVLREYANAGMLLEWLRAGADISSEINVRPLQN